MPYFPYYFCDKSIFLPKRYFMAIYNQKIKSNLTRISRTFTNNQYPFEIKKIGVCHEFYKKQMSIKFTFWLPFLLMVFTISCKTTNQIPPHKEFNPQEILSTLKKDGLIVILPTNKRKINLLHKAAVKSRDKKIEEKYQKALREREDYTENIFRSLSKYYNFGPYYFLPDSLVKILDSGGEVSFLNDQGLETHHIISPNKKRIKFVQFGKYWQLKTDHKTLPGPFPYKIDGDIEMVNPATGEKRGIIGRIGSGLGSIFRRTNNQKVMDAVVNNLVYHLNKLDGHP